MNTNKVTKVLESKLRRTFMVALLLVALFSLVPAGNAGAWYYAGTSGRAGAVAIPTVYILDTYMGSTVGNIYTLASDIGPLAYRSPASTGTQVVGMIYQYEKWNGSAWVVSARSNMVTRQILTGQNSVRFPAVYMTPTDARGTFRITWTFVWNTTTGANLGGTVINPSTINDHKCLTPYRNCRVYIKYFTVGI
jgi:hypothetical protein